MTRLRALMERPVDPEIARAVVWLALAVTIGLACLVGLSKKGDGHPAAGRPASSADVTSAVATRPARSVPHVDAGRGRPRRQDGQDRPGTIAHRRAARELAAHRALQHLPWDRGRVTITLIGARAGRAVLAVRAPSVAAARRAWSRFLRRFDDRGRAYLPRFDATRRAG